MDFALELQKLLDEEDITLQNPLEEIAKSQLNIIESIAKNSSDISLQVEEIYDIIKDSEENAQAAKNAVKREETLLRGLIAVNDLLDSILQYLTDSDLSHIKAIEEKQEEIISACGIEKTGFTGQKLEPKLHTVASAEQSDAPYETVTQVLESGYIYKGSIVRKATVIVSKGNEQ